MTFKLIPQALAQTVVDIETPATAGNFFGYTCLGSFISNLVAAAFIISGLVFFIFLVLGGLEWLMAAGDKAKVDSAQKRLTNALIGLTIVAASYAIFTLVVQFFGIDLSSIGCPEHNPNLNPFVPV